MERIINVVQQILLPFPFFFFFFKYRTFKIEVYERVIKQKWTTITRGKIFLIPPLFPSVSRASKKRVERQIDIAKEQKFSTERKTQRVGNKNLCLKKKKRGWLVFLSLQRKNSNVDGTLSVIFPPFLLLFFIFLCELRFDF